MIWSWDGCSTSGFTTGMASMFGDYVEQARVYSIYYIGTTSLTCRGEESCACGRWWERRRVNDLLCTEEHGIYSSSKKYCAPRSFLDTSSTTTVENWFVWGKIE